MDDDLLAAEQRQKDAKADLEELMQNRKYEIEDAAAVIMDDYEDAAAVIMDDYEGQIAAARAELNTAQRRLNDIRRAIAKEAT